MSLSDMLTALVIGLGAGLIGGLAGIGGSIVMLPALGLVFGFSGADAPEQHLYMAAAMTVNVVVALASSRKHKDEGALDTTVRDRLLPGMIVGVIGGVLVSNLMDGKPLKQLLVVFLFVYAGWTLVQTVMRLPDHAPEQARSTWSRLGPIGGGTGLLAGLLGIGGGIVMVPCLQLIAKVPIRRAIAASASVMWLSAGVGAAIKVWTLHAHGQSRVDALSLAAGMSLGAVVGSPIGAWLTHRLKLPALRVAIAVILAAGGARSAGWW
jgi:uncharacterized membrane protein YfcA